MGNATSSVAEIKKKGDEYNKAVRRERALSGMPGLAQQMSSKRFKKDDPYAEQWKVWFIFLFGRPEQRRVLHRQRAACMLHSDEVHRKGSLRCFVCIPWCFSASRGGAPRVRLFFVARREGRRVGYETISGRKQHLNEIRLFPFSTGKIPYNPDAMPWNRVFLASSVRDTTEGKLMPCMNGCATFARKLRVRVHASLSMYLEAIGDGSARWTSFLLAVYHDLQTRFTDGLLYLGADGTWESERVTGGRGQNTNTPTICQAPCLTCYPRTDCFPGDAYFVTDPRKKPSSLEELLCVAAFCSCRKSSPTRFTLTSCFTPRFIGLRRKARLATPLQHHAGETRAA